MRKSWETFHWSLTNLELVLCDLCAIYTWVFENQLILWLGNFIFAVKTEKHHSMADQKLACITDALWAKWGEGFILREGRDWGRRKIKRLLPVHCSDSSHVHYINVASQLVNWWRNVLARFWHVCLKQNGRQTVLSLDDAVREALRLFPHVPEIKEKQKKWLNLLLKRKKMMFLDCFLLGLE